MGFNTLPSNLASPTLTTAIEAKYDELQSIKVDNFGRSFFKETISKVMYPAIEVRRGSEKIAVDVFRGHQGIRHQVTQYTQKAFEPLYYKNFFDATQLEGYYRMFGSASFNMNDALEVGGRIATERKAMTDTIERTTEKNCMEIMLSGTITAANGTILDFKRQADSFIDNGAGFYWDNPAHDIKADIRSMCEFVKRQGKANDYVMNLIVGTDAWGAMRKNEQLQKEWNSYNNKRDMLPPAQLEATGAIFQMEMDVDTFKARIFVYDATYQSNDDNESPTFEHYMDTKKVVCVASNPEFVLYYGAVPRVRTDLNTSSMLAGKFIFRDFINEEQNYHRFYVESAPLPVPVALNKMCTLQALAAS